MVSVPYINNINIKYALRQILAKFIWQKGIYKVK